jgi:protocatechuate 3,4-dioxygenase beta subunit
MFRDLFCNSEEIVDNGFYLINMVYVISYFGVRQMETNIFVGFLLFTLSANAVIADCSPTPHRTTGTHYKPVTLEKTDVSKGVMVTGQVIAAPDCKPVANAKVAHWQAGEQGRYLDRLRAYLFTDSQGRYRFETEWPDMQTPHIHFIVTADGYKTLETQWIGDERQKEIVFNMVLIKQ